MEQQSEPQAPPADRRLPVSFDQPYFDIESLVSGLVLVAMLGFVSMMFIGCFDVGLVV